MFLETITFLGNDVLVPISKIECVTYKATDNGYQICIKGQGEWEWQENFDSIEPANERYKMIKQILKAK